MRSILIIEDDHDIRVAMRTVLESEGFTVLSATNGRDGLALVISAAKDDLKQRPVAFLRKPISAEALLSLALQLTAACA